jgi:excisionase family DNA binding protein
MIEFYHFPKYDRTYTTPMKDVFPLPDIPGYADIKEAARILGVAESSIYRYIQSGRLPAFQAGRNIMVELEALNQFKPGLTGRPRKKASLWRMSPDTGSLLIKYIRVQIRAGQQQMLEKGLWKIRQLQQHLFPGTGTRYISVDNETPPFVTIQLVWKSGDMPDEEARQRDFEAFKEELADVLDWNTAQYSTSRAIIHT